MQLNEIFQKNMKSVRKLNLTNASERELYGLRYIGGYAILHQLDSYTEI